MKTIKILQLHFVLVTLAVISVKGQISTPCTTSLISSFTPCLNFVTGSTANGGNTPTTSCCNALKSLMTTSVECGCLVVSANVPIPISRTLALSLPRACNMAVPVQCKASGTPLPAPGPVPFLLGPAAESPSSPQASIDATSGAAPTSSESETPLDLSPETPPEEGETPTTSTQGIRPVATPFASSSFSLTPATTMLLMAIGIMVFQFS